MWIWDVEECWSSAELDGWIVGIWIEWRGIQIRCLHKIYPKRGNLHFLLVPPLSCHCCWSCSWWPAAVDGVREEWLLSYWNDHQILCLHCPPESYLSRWCPLERDFLRVLLNCEEQAENWMGGPESICGYRIGPADLVIYLLGLCRIEWIRVFVYGQIPLH